MNARFRSLFAVTAFLPLASCEKPVPPAISAVTEASPYNAATESQLAEARDALQRQALEIETKTALMDKQLAEMEQALKDRENAELRGSLEALKQQNESLRAQADTARQQSQAVTQRLATTPRVNVTPQVSAPRDHSLFYDQLAPYGRWMDVSGYGYCWRPTLTTARWRPYVDGCWVWSSMGWTWQSNEPFGWATYHYGRWVNLSRHGWVWVPGSEWAPAWVSWRQSRDHVGWAPLPPDRGSISGVYRDCDTQYNLGPSSYTFITTNHFVQPSYTTYCAPVTQNTTIFQSSVNVTQIVRCDDQPRRGMFQHHGGPPRAQMERDCARPVPQIQLQSIAASEIPRSRPGHRRPEALAQPVMVELPLLRADAPAMRPQMAERVEKPRRVDAFEGIPQRVATEIRETIAAEKLTATVQQPVAVIETTAPLIVAQPVETPAIVVGAPVVEPASSETVRPAMPIEDKPMTQPAAPVAAVETSVTSTPPAIVPAVVDQPAATAAEPEKTPPTTVVMPAEPVIPAPTVTVEATRPTVSVVPVEIPSSQPPVLQTMPAVTATPVPQQNEPPAQQPAAAENMAVEQAVAAEAEKTRMQAEAAAMQQRQQEELAAQQRAMSEKAAADQALAAAETERARQQAEANAMQQRQQEELAAQQRDMAENRAAEQAQAAAEAERARQQAEAVAMQLQQEEAARRAQEMAQREAEELARRQAEVEMRRAQEEAERRAQEMARQQAEEQARRAAEEQMRQQQEMAQRQAEEQARRAAEEQMRRAQEEAQRAAAEAAQRAAQEAAQRAAEAAQRAAEDAARNQPQTGS
jgi:hypothetical protein